jgi:hypothetical protein
VLAAILDRWKRGAKVRGTGPDSAQDWLDAARVLHFCKLNAGQDIAVRRASALLFRDSKRIQDVWRPMEVLWVGNLESSQKDMEEVLADVGLVRFPPTFLVAADGEMQCRSGSVPAVSPYVGIPPSELEGITFAQAPRLLLTVENLTTFHELAASRLAGCVLLYTGGMPARSWTGAYRRVLQAVPDGCAVQHWGDIDAGGFRIAAHLARICELHRRALRLHAMEWRVPTQLDAGRAFLPSEVKQIQGICKQWGWHAEGEAIAAATHPIEQEELPALWPPVPSA